MKFSEFADVPVIDCHVHFGGLGAKGVEQSSDDLRRMSKFYVDIITEGKLSGMYATGGDAGLYLKAKFPKLFYAGGFVPWSNETNSLLNINWNKYISTLSKLGFEGIGEMIRLCFAGAGAMAAVAVLFALSPGARTELRCILSAIRGASPRQR